MKIIQKCITLFLIFTQVLYTFSQTVNNRQRNLFSLTSRSLSSRSTSNRGNGGGGSGGGGSGGGGSGGEGSTSTASSGGLSTAAIIALYVCVPVGFCLIVTMITLVCRRYRAQQVKKQQQQVQQDLQFNNQNAFQQMCQVNQNVGQSTFYNQELNNNHINNKQPQQFQFQENQNQNNQSYF
ncbi:hypothetical protein ABPG72_013627 [Tetrahymena utriculariae]